MGRQSVSNQPGAAVNLTFNQISNGNAPLTASLKLNDKNEDIALPPDSYTLDKYFEKMSRKAALNQVLDQPS